MCYKSQHRVCLAVENSYGHAFQEKNLAGQYFKITHTVKVKKVLIRPVYIFVSKSDTNSENNMFFKNNVKIKIHYFSILLKYDCIDHRR